MNNYGVTPDVFGSWVFVAACCVTMFGMGFWAWNQARMAMRQKPKRSLSEKYLTRAEAAGQEAETTARLDRHERHTSTRIDELTREVKDLRREVDRQPAAVSDMIDDKLGPVVAKVDECRLTITAIAAKMGVPVQHG